MSRKKFIIFLIPLFVVLLLSACATNVKIGSTNVSTSKQWKMSFHYLDGEEGKELHLKRGQTFKLNYSSEVESGTLTLAFVSPSGHGMAITPNTSGVEEIEISETGSYLIYVKAEKAKGKFQFSWQ